MANGPNGLIICVYSTCMLVLRNGICLSGCIHENQAKLKCITNLRHDPTKTLVLQANVL